jgi:hypothetical protein
MAFQSFFFTQPVGTFQYSPSCQRLSIRKGCEGACSFGLAGDGSENLYAVEDDSLLMDMTQWTHVWRQTRNPKA